MPLLWPIAEFFLVRRPVLQPSPACFCQWNQLGHLLGSSGSSQHGALAPIAVAALRAPSRGPTRPTT
eukprot:scaffold764_cov248-Pinguiococcus_pyrenoidosus.AAC.4